MKKRLKLFLSLILALSLLLSGCGSVAQSPEADEILSMIEEGLELLLSEETGANDDSPRIEVPSTQAGSEDSQTSGSDTSAAPSEEPQVSVTVVEAGEYSSKEEVALYLYLYGHLPGNYITKKAAGKLGWDSSKGNLWDVAPGKSIGGDSFGNYEGLLPEADGRSYHECDIDYQGGYRGSKRILFSDDGLIYYTEDHYTSFELLYGEE